MFTLGKKSSIVGIKSSNGYNPMYGAKTLENTWQSKLSTPEGHFDPAGGCSFGADCLFFAARS